MEKFDVQNDPQEIIIDFKESRISDMSAIDAVNKLTKIPKIKQDGSFTSFEC
jgi:SulP family sulfate permease